jgi:serine/threonine-protein phosphatase PGAM5
VLAAEAGDYVPPGTDHEEYTPDDGRLARAAIDRFTTVGVDSYDLVVTHSFTVGWLVRHALGAPEGRWGGLNAANAGLTVILCRTDRPAMLLTFNDQSHLAPEHRWTGFPPQLRPR